MSRFIIHDLQDGTPWEKIGTINHDDILYIPDGFDQAILTNILERFGKPRCIIADYVSIDPQEFLGVPCFFYPTWLEYEIQNFCSSDIDWNPATAYSFNFTCNKKQINRYLLCKFVEMFDLSNYDYTWSGIGREFDMTEIIDELNSLGERSPLDKKQRSSILAPIKKLEKKFIDAPGKLVDSEYTIGLLHTNRWIWDNGLSDLFQDSAVALITDSIQYQKYMHFTEKSLYSAYGLNFPIWVGGYKSADCWKSLGFDIFDDIIDHSYQYHDTLIERCYFAIKDNLSLLKNLSRVSDLRKKHMDRLLANRSHARPDAFAKAADKFISQWPDDVQQVLKYIRNRQLGSKKHIPLVVDLNDTKEGIK